MNINLPLLLLLSLLLTPAPGRAAQPRNEAIAPPAARQQQMKEADAQQPLTRWQAEQLGAQLHILDRAIAEGFEQAKQKYKSAPLSQMLSNALPPRSIVLKNKDKISFRRYGNLAELYLFNGKLLPAEDIRLWTLKNSDTVLGAQDPAPWLINSDFALYYYNKGEYEKAYHLFKEAIANLEKLKAVAQKNSSHNNLISAYAGIAEIAWKTGKKNEAIFYIRKIVNLHQPDVCGKDHGA